MSAKTTTEELQLKINEAQSVFEKAFKAWYEVQKFCEDENINLYALKYQKNSILVNLISSIENNGWKSSSLFC